MKPAFTIPADSTATPDWADLVAVEPMLGALAGIVGRMSPPQVMPDYWRTWSRIKALMQELAGWEAIDPRLRTEAAYNVAHDYLLDLYERRAAECGEASA